MTVATELKLNRVAADERRIPAEVLQQLVRAISNLGYGSVEVVIHDSRVMQIEVREKIRFQSALR